MYRYITEAVHLLAASTPHRAEALRAASRRAIVILDDTLVTADRVYRQWSYYFGAPRGRTCDAERTRDAEYFSRLLG